MFAARSEEVATFPNGNLSKLMNSNFTGTVVLFWLPQKQEGKSHGDLLSYQRNPVPSGQHDEQAVMEEPEASAPAPSSWVQQMM